MIADRVAYDTHTVHIVVQGDHREIIVRQVGETLIPMAKSPMQVMPYSSQFCTGGLLLNMLGKYVFTGLESGYELPSMRLPELDECIITES